MTLDVTSRGQLQKSRVDGVVTLSGARRLSQRRAQRGRRGRRLAARRPCVDGSGGRPVLPELIVEQLVFAVREPGAVSCGI